MIYPDGYIDHIICGDCLEVMKTLPDSIAQTCITSPPYWGLRDYGVDSQLGLEKTPEEYVTKMVAVFREVRRVLKDDGTMWLNLGDSYNGSGGAGGDYSSGGLRDGQPKYGRKFTGGLKPKDLIGIPWRVAFALQADGWWLRSDIIWSKPNPMPESVTDRPTKAHEYLFLMSKSAKYYYDADAIREPNIWKDDPRNDGERHETTGKYKSAVSFNSNGRNKRSVWTITTQPFPEAHFAVMPEKLVEPCVLAGSREGDTVLDPFMGAGTVAYVAKEFRRQYIGIELNAEYVKITENRLRQGTL